MVSSLSRIWTSWCIGLVLGSRYLFAIATAYPFKHCSLQKCSKWHKNNHLRFVSKSVIHSLVITSSAGPLTLFHYTTHSVFRFVLHVVVLGLVVDRLLGRHGDGEGEPRPFRHSDSFALFVVTPFDVASLNKITKKNLIYLNTIWLIDWLNVGLQHSHSK